MDFARKLLVTTVTAMVAVIPAAANVSAEQYKKISELEIGEYVQLGTYSNSIYSSGSFDMNWRVIDKNSNGPLMFSTKVIDKKIYDEPGTDVETVAGNSHSRDLGAEEDQSYSRKQRGSNYWADSNVRSWLNSDKPAGEIEWLCGNKPNESNSVHYKDTPGFLTNFDETERGLIKSVTQRTLVSSLDAGLEANAKLATGAVTGTDGGFPTTKIADHEALDYMGYLGQDVTDKVFLLDAKQLAKAQKLNGFVRPYGLDNQLVNAVYRSPANYPSSNADRYKRRASGILIHNVGVASGDSWLTDNYVNDNNLGSAVRPAFYLDDTSDIVLVGDGTEENPFVIADEITWNIEDVVIDETTVDVTMRVGTEPQNPKLVLGVYDEDDKLIDVLSQDIAGENASFDISGIESIDYVKVFLWEDLEKITPVAKSNKVYVKGQHIFYPLSLKPELSLSLFENPTSEYKGAPFWGWNGKLEEGELIRQIEIFKEMGFGGFHIHAREGLSTKYLGDEFMRLVKSTADKARSEDMIAYLYDEDKWPSGFAGGYVTDNIKNREKRLVFSPTKPANPVDPAIAVNTGDDYIVACYDVKLNSDGTIAEYRKINDGDTAENTKWYAYITTTKPSSWYNNKTYVDTLSKDAIGDFINVTHEAYKNAVGDEFGKTVPSIFTDEPHYASVKFLNNSTDQGNVLIPWTPTLTEFFESQNGYDILDRLPEVFWEQSSGDTSVRYDYHNCVSEMFEESFVKQISDWCKGNNIELLGHVLQEDKLSFQTDGVGEAMKLYPYFGMPGVDLLFNGLGYNTLKQAQSVAHQYDREGVVSELYGVTGWNFDFRGHKFQGDWQAALGVTLRVHHHSWYTMEGAAKRDYPASISYQSPWYKEYSYIEDHYSRLNTALTRGEPVVNIGVIHPIESMWTAWGPADKCKTTKSTLDSNNTKLTEWLLFSGLDFDFISEALLSDKGGVNNDKLVMNAMEYSTIIVPGNITMRQSTIDLLNKYVDNGGKLIFMGDCPTKVDGQLSDAVKSLYDKSTRIAFDKTAVVNAIESERFIEMTNSDGSRNSNLIYTLRKDNADYWIFIANAKKIDPNNDKLTAEKTTFTLNGEFTPVLYDTMTGEIKEIPYSVENGKTVIVKDMYVNDSLLLKLMPYNGIPVEDITEPEEVIETVTVDNDVDYSLEEENVYVIDMADYNINGGSYKGSLEEFRRIQNAARSKCGLWDGTQPWTDEEEEVLTNYVTIKFDVVSDIDITNAHFCAESFDEVYINDEPVALNEEDGYFVDRSIKKYKLPELKAGTNTFVIKVMVGRRTTLENMFITGNFGVTVDGHDKKIVAAESKLSFGDTAKMTMPFYGGNIIYKTNVDVPECGKMKITVPKYAGTLIDVIVDGNEAGKIVFSPYQLYLEGLEAGEHTVEFKLYGNRANTFGPLHLANPNYINLAPKAWETTGDDWSYDYQLKQVGIMQPPVIEFIK